MRTGNATIVRQVTRLLELMARDLNKLPQRQPDPPPSGRIMSGRQHKKKRRDERRRYVQRFMAPYIAELRQILRRAWPEYERRHPDTRGPCHTCAFNPSTDTWPGFEKTVFGLLETIRKGAPFYCHEHLRTDVDGDYEWDGMIPPTVCRGWEAIAAHPDTAGLKRTVVDTTGQELIVVQRTDLTAGDPRATGLALADNRAGDLIRRWGARQVTTDAALLDASAVRIFAPVEMADFAAELNKPAAAAEPADDDHTVRLTFETPDQVARWAA